MGPCEEVSAVPGSLLLSVSEDGRRIGGGFDDDDEAEGDESGSCLSAFDARKRAPLVDCLLVEGDDDASEEEEEGDA